MISKGNHLQLMTKAVSLYMSSSLIIFKLDFYIMFPIFDLEIFFSIK